MPGVCGCRPPSCWLIPAPPPLPQGHLYTWGNGWYCKLGHGDTTSRHTPSRVEGLEGVMAVSCGARHTAALLRPAGSAAPEILNHGPGFPELEARIGSCRGGGGENDT